MSLKALSKTRWTIENDRVVIYPYGVFYMFTAIIAVLFTGLLVVYMRYENVTSSGSLTLALLVVFMVFLFWAFASTYLEFDARKARMRKMLMGFLPVNTIPFAELSGISPVSNNMGSYTYRLFKKDARYGKGIVASSGYTKNDDPNAVAFVNEAVTIIHNYLDQYDTPAERMPEVITQYKYFTEQGGVYVLKNRKAGALVMGALFIGLGLFFTTIQIDGTLSKIGIVGGMILFGLIFINAAYTKLSFNTVNQTIERKGIANFFNKQYSFGAFAGVQTLRRSVNFVYIGTEVNMYFDVVGKSGKQDMLTASSFRRSADIERFIKEVYQIMGLA